MQKSNHQANIVKIGAILPHPDPETTKLELTMVGGYQLVVGKGAFKEGDLAVFIQPDSVVPQTTPFNFIWKDHVGIDGIAPESRRRITVRRFRKQWSEGLLMPLTDLPELTSHMMSYREGKAYTTNITTSIVVDGDDVADLLGITHWVPPFDKESTGGALVAAPKRKYPRSLKGWCFWTLHKLGMGWGACGRGLALDLSFDYPIYDVDAYKNHRNWMPEGTLVHVTEKIHGSNARYTFTNDVFYAGSHEQWKQRGTNVWWKAAEQHPEIEAFCRRNPNTVLYGEVGPTQGDKWRYGCEAGETFFFAFHVYHPDRNAWEYAGNAGFEPSLIVPSLYYGPFGLDVLALVDGPTTVPGATGIREGIVIRIIGDVTSRNNLKIVSNQFLERDK